LGMTPSPCFPSPHFYRARTASKMVPLIPLILLSFSPPTPEPAMPPSYRNSSPKSVQSAAVRAWFRRGQGIETPIFGTPLLHLHTRTSLNPLFVFGIFRSSSPSSTDLADARTISGRI
jgi:hypothetical protein